MTNASSEAEGSGADQTTVIESALQGLGACWRCALRGKGCRDEATYLHQKGTAPDAVDALGPNSASASEDVETCGLCLGLLELERIPGGNAVLKSALVHHGFEADSHQLTLQLPPICVFRQYILSCYIKEALDKSGMKDVQHNVVDLKDTLRWILGKELENVGLPVAQAPPGSRVPGALQVTVACKYAGSALSDLGCCVEDEAGTQSKRRGTAKRARLESGLQGVSIGKVQQVLVNATPQKCLELLGVDSLTKCLGKAQGCVDVSVTLGKESLFFRGRYVKLSRHLSQSPWFIDGERRGESSVEERIVGPMQSFFGARACRFHAEGREDMDVRMLGSGRPFCVEIQDPKRTSLACADVMAKVNSGEGDVLIRELRPCTAADMENLQQDAENHRKTYVCVCWVKRALTATDIEKLNATPEFELQQKTPVRVLHRRSLAVRPRTIYWLKARLLNDHYIELRLSTQAGTYVKEFVHGDLGRTRPSLRTLLECPSDILQLDVEGLSDEEPK